MGGASQVAPDSWHAGAELKSFLSCNYRTSGQKDVKWSSVTLKYKLHVKMAKFPEHSAQKKQMTKLKRHENWFMNFAPL